MQRIKFIKNVKRCRKIYPLTFVEFLNLLNSNEVREIVEYYRDHSISYEKRYSKKRELPGIYWQIKTSMSTVDGLEGLPSGIVVLDIDHVPDVEKVYEKTIQPRIDELNIIFVQKSVSGEGLHIGFYRNPKLTTIAANQLWMANELGVKNFDRSVSDIQRTWFVTPMEEWLYINFRAVKELLDVKPKRRIRNGGK